MPRYLMPALAFSLIASCGFGHAAMACHVVGYANGEPLCETTSDGAGQPYTPAKPFVSKAKQAMEIHQDRMVHLAAYRYFHGIHRHIR